MHHKPSRKQIRRRLNKNSHFDKGSDTGTSKIAAYSKDYSMRIEELIDILAASNAVPIAGNNKEENLHAEEGALQRDMLNDPRFGSPLLCDVVVMLLSLVPLLCGLKEYFSGHLPATSSLSGYHYGLTLCGIFIFLLGLRSASIHLINMKESPEERVLYILNKFGGSVWIPMPPDLPSFDANPTPNDQHAPIGLLYTPATNDQQSGGDIKGFMMDSVTKKTYMLRGRSGSRSEPYLRPDTEQVSEQPPAEPNPGIEQTVFVQAESISD